MHEHQLLQRCQRRIVMSEIHIDPLSNKVIVNSREPTRCFRMEVTHVVFKTIRMCNKRGTHKPYPSPWRIKTPCPC